MYRHDSQVFVQRINQSNHLCVILFLTGLYFIDFNAAFGEIFATTIH
jgi:hypothetical protein